MGMTDGRAHAICTQNAFDLGICMGQYRVKFDRSNGQDANAQIQKVDGL